MSGSRAGLSISLTFHRLRILTRCQIRCGYRRGRLPTSNRRIGGTVCVLLCPLVTGIESQIIRLVDCYAAYFGSLTCVAWSPDGRFIIVSLHQAQRGPSSSNTTSSKTGGQDDLVNIFSPWEQRVIARCQGHSSFLSGLAFDDLRCDGRTYRFGSVGEDNKLILVKYIFFQVLVELALM